MKQTLLLGIFLLILGCQNHLPKQPQMLPLEMQLLDSIQHLPEWRYINRFVTNTDNDSIGALAAQNNATWDYPYEYYLELSTKDLETFKSVDSTYINSIYEHLLAVLPKENLQSITITLSYTYKDRYETEQADTKSFNYSINPH